MTTTEQLLGSGLLIALTKLKAGETGLLEARDEIKTLIQLYEEDKSHDNESNQDSGN